VALSGAEQANERLALFLTIFIFLKSQDGVLFKCRSNSSSGGGGLNCSIFCLIFLYRAFFLFV
jgi:hypothetical protein